MRQYIKPTITVIETISEVILNTGSVSDGTSSVETIPSVTVSVRVTSLLRRQPRFASVRQTAAVIRSTVSSAPRLRQAAGSTRLNSAVRQCSSLLRLPTLSTATYSMWTAVSLPISVSSLSKG